MQQVLMASIRRFLALEAAGGILLAGAALVALMWENSPAGPLYDAVLSLPVSVQIGPLALAKPLVLWINDGLMAIFFLLVGIEIKREVMEGELSSRERAILPVIAALGGMAAPAIVYLALTGFDPASLNGWAIPTATDIAFSLGVLSLLGNRVPSSLKVFLLALAIIDDLGAIVIIAIFYTADLSLASLIMAAVALCVLFALNARGVIRLAPYVIVGLILWVSVLKSGVHATLSGVALAFAIPLKSGQAVEEGLHPWVVYLILPLFAFANSGVSFTGLTLDFLTAPIPLGVALGLFLGKQAGVFLVSWLAIRLGIARLPEEATWLQFYGIAVLTGIGFTMSLFIGTLAFSDPAAAAAVRMGVLLGSLLSTLLGLAVLRLAAR
jgi:Na+:H+ antiporter, NhaA family